MIDRFIIQRARGRHRAGSAAWLAYRSPWASTFVAVAITGVAAATRAVMIPRG
jgi:hypothetical protein